MNCCNHKLFLLLLSLVLFFITSAQQEYLFSHLGTRDGLVANDVIAAQQDKEGFIWIATLNGLQRYDGSRFLTFRHKANDTTSIPGNRVMRMQMDNKNRLWLLCDDNEVGYFNTTNFKFHPVHMHAETTAIKRANGELIIDESGNIFFRLYGEPLLIFNQAANMFSPAPYFNSLPANWHITSMYQDKQHNYWLACDSGLIKLNTVTKRFSYRDHNVDNDEVIKQYEKLTYASHFFIDSKGRFWIVLWPPSPGLTIYSFNIHTKKEEQWAGTISGLLRSLYYELDNIQELSDSSLWFSGYNILAAFNNKANGFNILKSDLPGEYTIHYDMVYQLYEDREKNIWICTNKGLYRFNPSAQLFHTISLKLPGKDTLYTPDVSGIMHTRSGDILVSTWSGGIFAYDSSLEPKRIPYVEASYKGWNRFTWFDHERANGDIWSGCQDGNLFIIHPATNQVERLQLPVFEGSTIRQIAEDKSGNLWLGFQKGLLVKWNAATNTFTLMQRLHSAVYRLYADWQGNIWACTLKNGVYKINAADGSIAFNYTANGDAAKRLTAVGANDIIQYDDSLYVIASGGLNILNTKANTIRYLDVDNEAFSNTTSNIVKDKQGLLWVTTQSGLFSINIKNGAATNYNERNGLQNNYFNEGATCTLNDGRIALGTAHNFIVFNPAEVMQTEAATPKVVITGFALMNKWLLMDSLARQKSITLPYDQNSITVAFSTLAFQKSYTILYKLEGLDKDWISAKNSEAIYSYLPPGSYTFKIRAVNANDVFSPEATTLFIIVQSPFWKTWWFYSLLLLALIAFLYWLDRERMKRKAVLQSMRSNISGNLHEEINNALQNINVLSEIARIKADKEPKQSKNYIDEINHKSNSLIEAMDDMLWSIDPANDTMAQTTSRMKEIAHTVSHQYNVAIQVNTDDKINLLKPDMKRRHEIMVLYKMALRLLATEMQAHHIFVEFNYIKSHVQLNIFAANIKLTNSSHVLNIMTKLNAKASAAKGTLEVQADEKGVAIIVAVKR